LRKYCVGANFFIKPEFFYILVHVQGLRKKREGRAFAPPVQARHLSSQNDHFFDERQPFFTF